MLVLRSVLLLVSLSGVFGEPREPRPAFLELYDLPDQSGDFVVIEHPQPYLQDIGFDNRASSYCVSGIFILYQDNNYNSNNLQGASVWSWSPELFCDNVVSGFDNRASSVRFSGDTNDFEGSSLNFYQGEGFNGREHFYFADAPTVVHDNEGSSIIVTGCEPWTLYEYDNYEGRSVCIYPDDNCVPGFYPASSSLGGFANIVSSVRRGCFAAQELQYTSKAESGSSIVTGSFNLQ